MNNDYYKILGISRNATDKEIKKAYRSLAMKYHPDKNPDDSRAESKFKEVSEAYYALSNPEKRRNYDQFGSTEGSYGFEGNPFEGFSGFGGFGGFEDFFDNVFRGNKRQGPRRGRDMITNISISFNDAAFGCSKSVTIKRTGSCKSCLGSGSRIGSSMKSCYSCNGRGRKRQNHGHVNIDVSCNVCNGAGTIPESPCIQCGGMGIKEVEDTVKVKIPAGVDSGSKLRLSGRGESIGGKGSSGDLIIEIVVIPSDEFKRIGTDVYSEKDIDVSLAALGGSISVNTIHGSADVTIPSGTQPGTKLRLKSKGIKRLKSNTFGDHYINVNIVIPRNLTRDQMNLFKQLKKTL